MKKLLVIIIALLSNAAPMWAACGTSYLDKLVTTGTAAAVGTTANPILGQGGFIPATIAVVNCVGVSLSSVTDGGGAYKVKISEINMVTRAFERTEGGCTSDNVSITSGSSGTEIIFPNLSCYLMPTKSYGIAVFKANGGTDAAHYVSLLSKSTDNGLAGFRMIWNANGTLKSMSTTVDFGLKLYTAKPVTKGLYTYVMADGKAIITATSCGMGNVTIPDTLGGYPVAVIGSSVFAACDKITSITVPASVTRIEMYGLKTAKPLTSAYFKGDAPTIDENGILFLKEGAKVYYCSGAPGYTNPWKGYETAAETCKGSSYTTTVSTVSTTTTILVENGYSYKVADNQSTITAHECPTGALVIPDTLGGYPTVAIADNVFTGCTGLTSVTIPNSVRTIGTSAFSGCTGLTSLTMPASITSIAYLAFYDCTNLYNVHFSGNAPTMILDEVAPFFKHKLGFTVYYRSGATGFTQPWYTYLTAVETTPKISAVWDRTTALIGINSEKLQELEPTLIQPEKGHSLFFDNNTTIWKMWFHGDNYVGSSKIYYAESLDGINWTKCLEPVVFDHVCPFVIKNTGTYYLYAANLTYTQIDEYTSSNGRNFTLAHANIIPLGDGESWNHDNLGNTSGVIADGVFYLFVDGFGNGAWSEGIYTSTDFCTYTPYAGNPVIFAEGTRGSVSIPQKIGDTWWLWMLGSATGVLPTDLYRYSAPALTGPWTQNPSGVSFPRITQDEGVGSSLGQVADPFIIEVNGKTYLYYTAGNDGAFITSGPINIIKLAIANMPISQLVQTDEYDCSLSYLLFIEPKTPWPK